jgi:putative DNA primase/helicase
MGDYAQQIPASAIMMKRYGGIPNDIARLAGVRLATASESGIGGVLDEGLLKNMAGGGDRIAARFMRFECFDFKPTFKVWLATNHRPRIRGNDPAVWDRIRLIPFDVTV